MHLGCVCGGTVPFQKKGSVVYGKKRALRLTESAIMLAFATILSMVKLVDLPYGGSITAFSMLPILLIAYRYGTGWGLFTAFAHSLLQLLLGMNALSYATSAGAAVAIILLDYVVAFLVLGLGGIFRGKLRSQGAALAAGAILTGALRYICHVISGCTVWAGLSIPDSHALLYSLAYNATYMVPEILITVVGAVYLRRCWISAAKPSPAPLRRPRRLIWRFSLSRNRQGGAGCCGDIRYTARFRLYSR